MTCKRQTQGFEKLYSSSDTSFFFFTGVGFQVQHVAFAERQYFD